MPNETLFMLWSQRNSSLRDPKSRAWRDDAAMGKHSVGLTSSPTS